MARAKGPINQDKLQQRYRQLLDATSRVVGQANRFSKEIAQGVNGSTTMLKQLAPEGLRQDLDEVTSHVRQVIKQTSARILRGNTRSEGKSVRAIDRGHSQGQSRQAQRVPQDGQVAGGREPDHH